MRGWGPLAGLPPVARWGVVGVAGLLLAAAVSAGVWTILQHREATARRAFAEASAAYRQAVGSTDEAALDGAARTLTQFITAHPRASAVAQGWYFLGNVEYRRRRFDAALVAFDEAARRDSGTVGILSRLDQGYTWEAKGEPARALEIYTQGLTGRGPKDFLYADLLLAVGRTQEQLKQPAAAIETYRRLLREVPDAARTEDIRVRLAILGASA
ncbi:MAG TPA: tetratricopeptide repeat protein [Methylomirabilota bacterium]|nr:tetratricopeptide repeat protein [Methylomirabilota bacterium]